MRVRKADTRKVDYQTLLKENLSRVLTSAGVIPPERELVSLKPRNQYSYCDINKTVFVKVRREHGKLGLRKATEEYANAQFVHDSVTGSNTVTVHIPIRHTEAPNEPLPVIIPGYGAGEPLWATVWEHLPGRYEQLNPENWTVKILDTVWHAMQNLQNFTVSAPTHLQKHFKRDVYRDPYSTLRWRVSEYRNDRNALLCDQLTFLAEVTAARWRETFGFLIPALSHGDLHAGNICVNNSVGGSPGVALCDWEGLKMESREREAAALRHNVVRIGGREDVWLGSTVVEDETLNWDVVELAEQLKAISAASYLLAFNDGYALEVLKSRVDALMEAERCGGKMPARLTPYPIS